MKNPFSNSKKEENHANMGNRKNGNEYSFAQKVGRFFSAEPQKEKVLRREDFHAAGDPYYATVSAGYKIAQRILWVFFVFFMVISIIANHQEITYDNFFYLIKDFTGAVDTDSNRYETLSYEADARQNFALYRGGVATVSPSKISVFTSTGRRTLNSTSSFSSPYMVTSGKYILIYDTSGTGFSIYNSFARVYTETLEYPVTGACFAEDGSFVIVTRSADSRSVICIYNKSFKKISELRSDAYVFGVSADKERDRIAVLSYESGNGIGRAVLSLREWSTLEEEKRMTFDGEFPLSCGFLENGYCALLSDHCIRIFDRELEEHEKSGDYSGGNITGYSLTSEGVAVCTIEASKNTVCAFDKSGKILYNGDVRHNVGDICVYEDFVFLRTESGVVRLHGDGSKKNDEQQEETLPSGQGKMLVYNERTVIVCGESKAEYLIFSNK